MRILITGAAGNVAAGVIRTLAGFYQLRLLDLVRSESFSDHEWITGSILDSGTLERALKDVQAVVHLAIIRKGQGGDWATEAMFDVNVRGLYMVLQAAVDAGIDRFVHIGSTAPVIGHWYAGENITIDSPYTTRGRYSLTKAIQELTCEHFARNTDLRVVVLRPWVPCDAGGGKAPEKYHPGLIDTEDLGLACRLAIQATGLDKFEIFHTVATPEAQRRFDADRTEKILGFRPRLNFQNLPSAPEQCPET